MDNATIFGTITSGGSTRVHLSGMQPAVFTLELEVPESESESMAGSYAVTVRASDGNKSDSKTFTLNVTRAGQGDFSISLTEDEVALVGGQASVGVRLQSASRGFNGDVRLSVEGLPSGVQATFADAARNGTLYLASDASTTLTLSLNGEPSQVKNLVKVVATYFSNGAKRSEASLMLYAFENSTIGTVIASKTPPYSPYEPVEDRLFVADARTAGNAETGEVFANAESNFVGSATARVVYRTDFTPAEEKTVTVEAKLRVRGFVINSDYVVAGISAGEANGYLGFGKEGYETLPFYQDFSFSIPTFSTAEPHAVEKIWNLIQLVQDASKLKEVVDKIKYYCGGRLEERTIQKDWDVGANSTYTVGAGVVAKSSSVLGMGVSVIVGCVDEIKVWNGSLPAVDLKFGSEVRDNASGLYVKTWGGSPSMAQGLAGSASNFNGSSSLNVELPLLFGANERGVLRGMSYETWVKPTEARDSTLIQDHAFTAFWNQRGGYSQSYETWEEKITLQGLDGRFGSRCDWKDTETQQLFDFSGNLLKTDVYARGDETKEAKGGSNCTGEWHHMVVVVDGNVCRLFVDGQLVRETSYTLKLPTWRGNGDSYRELLVGNGFNGLIEDVRVYGKPLSSGEIEQRYEAGPLR